LIDDRELDLCRPPPAVTWRAARFAAGQRADELLAIEETESYRTFMRVLDCIHILQVETPSGDVHRSFTGHLGPCRRK